jgi:N-acetylglutamate synthase-like GNAT family acetyltransferase
MNTPPPPSNIDFLTFKPEYAADFKKINLEWISSMFEVENGDLKSMDNPQQYIIDGGGEIFFAKHNRLGIVGCCALLQKQPRVFELTKMGVLQRARGLKIGEPLLQHVLKHAENSSIERLFLLTNWDCSAAIHLYLKNGFVHDEEVMKQYGESYDRCNVAMKYQKIWKDGH